MTMMTIARDINGLNTYAISPAQNIKNCVLLQGVSQSFTVPSNYDNWIAIFYVQPGAEFWVAYNNTVVIPTANTFTDSVSEMNPTARYLKAGDVVSVITPNTSARLGVLLLAQK